MNNNSENSKKLIINYAKILDNIEDIDDDCLKKSITDIKNAANEIKKTKKNSNSEYNKNEKQ